MTPQNEAEAIDFKPFFDMIVGILFILLIFIAAQLFFTQWDDPLAQIQARERSRQLAYRWQEQATNLLQDLAERLRGMGFSAEVNTIDQTVTLPLAELVSVSQNDAIKIDPRAESIGEMLAVRLSCIPGQDRSQPSDCAPLELLRLGGIRTEIRVARLPMGISLPPERYAYLLAALVSAQLLRGAPALVGFSGSGGVPALQPGSIVLGGATQAGLDATR